MPAPTAEGATDTRLTGDDLSRYSKAFAAKHLEGKIRFNAEVRAVRRNSSGAAWRVDILDRKTNTQETKEYARIVLCTGVGVVASVGRFGLKAICRDATLVMFPNV